MFGEVFCGFWLNKGDDIFSKDMLQPLFKKLQSLSLSKETIKNKKRLSVAIDRHLLDNRNAKGTSFDLLPAQPNLLLNILYAWIASVNIQTHRQIQQPNNRTIN